MKLKDEYRELTVINKSRFLACAMPCDSEEKARFYIDMIREEFPDASHVCTAYCIGPIQRSSDNKEPAGTAGVPILESIKKSGMDGICVCVVRWFGGIKLGAGGLIRAYGGCAADVLAHAPKVEEIQNTVWKLQYPYSLAGTLENALYRTFTNVQADYGEEVICTFEAGPEQNVLSIIWDLSKGQATPVCTGTVISYRDIE